MAGGAAAAKQPLASSSSVARPALAPVAGANGAAAPAKPQQPAHHHLGSAPIASLKSPPLNHHGSGSGSGGSSNSGGGALKDISNKANAAVASVASGLMGMVGMGGSSKAGAVAAAADVKKPAGAGAGAESYEISDREDSSDDDYDSDGGHAKVAKKVPDWAKGPALREALEAQFNRKQKLDPDSIFPEVRTCDLEAIFKSFQGQAGKKRSYRSRQSTGNWKRDELSSAEKLRYKHDMGYH